MEILIISIDVYRRERKRKKLEVSYLDGSVPVLRPCAASANSLTEFTVGRFDSLGACGNHLLSGEQGYNDFCCSAFFQLWLPLSLHLLHWLLSLRLLYLLFSLLIPLASFLPMGGYSSTQPQPQKSHPSKQPIKQQTQANTQPGDP